MDKVLACQTAKLPTHGSNSWRSLLMLNVPGVCPKLEPLILTMFEPAEFTQKCHQVSRARKVLGASEWKPTLYAQMAEILQSHQIWRCFVQFAECSSHRFSKFKNSFTSEQLHLFWKMKRSVWHVLAGGQVCKNMQFYPQNAIKTRWGNSKNEVGPHKICQQLPSSAYGWSFKKVSRFPVVSLTWRDAQPVFGSSATFHETLHPQKSGAV